MTEIAQAFVRIRPTSHGFKQEAEREVKQGLGGIGKVIGGAFAAVGLAEGVKSVAEAAASQQEELAVVRQAVKSTSAEWTIHGQTVDKVLREQAVRFGFTVSELAQGFTRLQVSTKDSAKSEELLGEAMDIARARHLGLAQAAVVVAKAQAGNVTGLQRLGIVIPKVTEHYDKLKNQIDQARAGGAKFTKEQELQIKAAYDHAKALDLQATKEKINGEILARFGGQSAAFAKTAEGSSERFHEAVNELEVAIGRGLLPTLTEAATGATELFKKLADGGEVESFAATTAQELASAWRVAVGIGRELAPVVTTIAHGLTEVTRAVGGGGILAFVAGYKALSVAQSVATAAQARWNTVMQAGAGVEVEATTAEEAHAASSTALTVALEANTAALATNAGARDAYIASTRLAIGSNTALVASNEAVTASVIAEDAALATQGASVGRLGTAFRGLFAVAGGWSTVVAVGLGAAALGFYKLVTAADSLEQANQNVIDSQGRLDASLQTSALLRQRLANLRDTLPGTKLAVARAQQTEEQAKQALLSSTAPRGSSEFKNLQLAFLEALNARKTAEKELNDQLKLTTETEKGLEYTRRKTARQARESADAVIANAAKIKQANATTAIGPHAVPNSLITKDSSPALQQALARTNERAVSQFVAATEREAEQRKNKTIRRNDELIAAYASQFKKIPSPPLIRFILDNTDPKAKLADLLKDFRKTGQTAAVIAHSEGEHAGRAFGAGMKSGIDSSSAQAAAAAAAAAHKIAVAAKKVLGIHSPSAVMHREVGVPIVQGIISGMRSVDVAAELAGILTGAVESGKAAIGAHSPSERTRREIGHSISDGVALGILDRNGKVIGSVTNQLDEAISSGVQSVRDAVVSAKQNLNSIAGSIGNDIGTLLEKRGQTSPSSPAQNERLHELLKLIHEGNAGTDTVRLAQAISNQAVARASVAQATGTDRTERIQRRLSDLSELLNRGSIRSEAVFDKRLNSILRSAGAGPGSALGKSSLGLAFADQLRAEIRGLRDQAKVILQSPHVRETGLEPQIVKPLDAIKAAQQQIADAAASQRQAQLAEAKRQTAEQKKHTKHLADIAAHTKGTATVGDISRWIKWAELHPKAATDAFTAAKTRHGHGG